LYNLLILRKNFFFENKKINGDIFYGIVFMANIVFCVATLEIIFTTNKYGISYIDRERSSMDWKLCIFAGVHAK